MMGIMKNLVLGGLCAVFALSALGCLSLNSNDAWDFIERGNKYYDRGEYDRAIENYTQAIRLNPMSAYAYNRRGDAYTRKGDYNNAIEDYTQAVTHDPDDADGYNGRGNAYIGIDEYDLAIADLTQAITIAAQSDDLLAYRYTINAYLYRGRAYHLKKRIWPCTS
jgi:tetratricopeptide (TPR) repeat protein